MIRLFTFLCAFLFNQAYASEMKILVPVLDDAYALNARIIAPYISKYLSDHPSVIIQGVPGAAGLVEMNYLYNIAPKDGSVIATVRKNMPITGTIGGDTIKFDPQKLNWLGSTMDGRKDAIIMWSNTETPNIIGTENYVATNFVGIVKKITGKDYKVITGYSDGQQTKIALERKEVDAIIYNLTSIKTSNPQWLEKNSLIQPILQFGNGLNKHPQFLGTPTLYELAKSEEHKKLLTLFENSLSLLRPFVAPPGVPENKINELREAFTKASKDPEYIKEANRVKIDVDLIDWKESTEIVKSLKSIDFEMMEKMKELFQ